MKQRPERHLTEAMLGQYYNKNAITFPEKGLAMSHLYQSGYTPQAQGAFYKDVHGRIARIYKLRDTVFSFAGEKIGYKTTGWLVSFGGAPAYAANLKFTKNKNGEI